MIYDEATIEFIRKRVQELWDNTMFETEYQEAYENVLDILKNIKKIKAIN